MSTPRFISLEGTEGAGKTTAMQVITAWLEARGHRFEVMREPGGTALAERIRDLVLGDVQETVHPSTELLLMFAARSQLINERIKPALTAGKWVISDRFVDSSAAYQTGGRGIDPAHLEYLTTWIVGDCMPDLTVWLDLPVATGLDRTTQRGGAADRIERQQAAFFEQVRARYVALAAANADRIARVDAAVPAAAVAQQIEALLSDRFE